jgi:hypothetical protein
MPRTAYTPIHYNAIDQRRMIMRAVRAHRKDLHTPADQDDLFVADVAEKHAAVRNLA